MIASKMSKLKKMRMPEKKGEDLAHMEEGSPEEESMESPLEEKAEDGLDLDMEAGKPGAEKQEGPGKNSAALEAVSDEELVAELKKRGLMSELEKGEGEEVPADDQEMYS